MPRDISSFLIGKTTLPGMQGKKSSSRKAIGKPLRDQVWLKYIGNKAQGKCYCCKIRTIHITDFQVGHNKAVAKGGSNNIANLRPICGPCNRAMRTKSIEWYRKKYFAKPSANRKIIKKTKSKKSSSGKSWINPLTGRKEKFNLFRI